MGKQETWGFDHLATAAIKQNFSGKMERASVVNVAGVISDVKMDLYTSINIEQDLLHTSVNNEQAFSLLLSSSLYPNTTCSTLI